MAFKNVLIKTKKMRGFVKLTNLLLCHTIYTLKIWILSYKTIFSIYPIRAIFTHSVVLTRRVFRKLIWYVYQIRSVYYIFDHYRQFRLQSLEVQRKKS